MDQTISENVIKRKDQKRCFQKNHFSKSKALYGNMNIEKLTVTPRWILTLSGLQTIRTMSQEKKWILQNFKTKEEWKT